MNAHDAIIGSDPLTSVTLNYEWRRFVIGSLQLSLSLGLRDIDEPDKSTVEELIDALINDLND